MGKGFGLWSLLSGFKPLEGARRNGERSNTRTGSKIEPILTQKEHSVKNNEELCR